MRCPNNISSLKAKIICGLTVITIIVVGLTAYWLKSNIGINFSEKYTLSEYFPFYYFTPNRIINNQPPGIILEDSFDSFSFFGNWTSLWMREQGKVTKELDEHGVENSRCLVIKSSSTKSWSYSHRNSIKVTKGDVFTFQVAVKLRGGNIIAQASVSASDENMSIVSWNYAKESTDIRNDWVLIKQTFTIPDNIGYIRLKLSGSGKGEFRFDDICFKKVAFSEKNPVPVPRCE